jgi:hypothetical protein
MDMWKFVEIQRDQEKAIRVFDEDGRHKRIPGRIIAQKIYLDAAVDSSHPHKNGRQRGTRRISSRQAYPGRFRENFLVVYNGTVASRHDSPFTLTYSL